MKTEIVQIEKISGEEFKNEILEGIKEILQNALKIKEPEKLLTREETAKLLSVSLTTLWDYTRKGIIPAYRIGSHVRYKREDVMNALQKTSR